LADIGSITRSTISPKYGSFGPDTRDDSDFILERHVSHSHLSLRHPYHATAVLAFRSVVATLNIFHPSPTYSSQKCAWSPMEPRPSSWQSAQSLCEDIRRWQADKPHSNGEEDNDTKMGWKCADVSPPFAFPSVLWTVVPYRSSGKPTAVISLKLFHDSSVLGDTCLGSVTIQLCDLVCTADANSQGDYYLSIRWPAT
jgi:hypothetical protein